MSRKMKKPKTPSSKPKSPTKPSLLYRLFTNTMVLATVVVLISCGFEAFFWHGKLIWLRFSDTAELKPYKGIEHVVFPAKVPSHRIVHVPGFFNDEHIEGVLRLGERVKKMEEESLFGLFKNLFKSSDGTTNIWDRYIFGRDQSTGYTQLLTRIESDLYESLPEVFNMVTRMAWGMDDLYWLKFPSANKMNKVQIELIDYNTNAIGKEATFNEHVDNYSVVSMIVMLSDTKDFKGGENFFRVNGTLPCFGSDPSAETMTLKLEKGDAIFFRGEVLAHGITPVTKGRRIILQSEMHVVRDDNDNGELGGVDCVP